MSKDIINDLKISVNAFDLYRVGKNGVLYEYGRYIRI